MKVYFQAIAEELVVLLPDAEAAYAAHCCIPGDARGDRVIYASHAHCGCVTPQCLGAISECAVGEEL